MLVYFNPNSRSFYSQEATPQPTTSYQYAHVKASKVMRGLHPGPFVLETEGTLILSGMMKDYFLLKEQLDTP